MAIPRLYKNRVFAPFTFTVVPLASMVAVLVPVTVLVPVRVTLPVPVLVPVTVPVPVLVPVEVMVPVVVAAQETETSSAYHISSWVSALKMMKKDETCGQSPGASH
eukprot:s175_g2.t1